MQFEIENPFFQTLLKICYRHGCFCFCCLNVFFFIILKADSLGSVTVLGEVSGFNPFTTKAKSHEQMLMRHNTTKNQIFEFQQH